jgi:hypothetical protein
MAGICYPQINHYGYEGGITNVVLCTCKYAQEVVKVDHFGIQSKSGPWKFFTDDLPILYVIMCSIYMGHDHNFT